LKIGHCKAEGRCGLHLHIILLTLYVTSHNSAGAQGQNKIGDFAGSPANSRGAVLQKRGQSSAYAKMGEEES
jgi:hypothetical protein